MRFPSHQVLRQCDARPYTLHHAMPSDGRFRLVVFGGDVADDIQRTRVNALGKWLRTSLLPDFGALGLSAGGAGAGNLRLAKDPSVVDVLLVHAAPREKVELLRDLDEAYRPFDERLGWDYGKVFVDGPSWHEGDGEAYKKYGVDKKTGAVILVRPDGYVGLVTGLGEDGWSELRKWFEGVLRTVG